MHFYYIDESGCNGRDLQNPEQPIFVAGGVIVRDEGWNQTNQEFWGIITSYFRGEIPRNFELHTADLFSTDGDGFFSGHLRDRRNKLVNNLLDLVIERSHQIVYVAIDKSILDRYDVTLIKGKDYFDKKVPYLIAYDYLISFFDWYTKEHLGKSARAMAIIDEKVEFAAEIAQITHFRRYGAPRSRQVKRITEFTYAINSRKNPMIQISDMICFLVRKYLEIDAGYKDTYPAEVKNIFRDFYRKIDERLQRKTIISESGRQLQFYNQFLSQILIWPSRNWRSTQY